jgi:hypothetical protein
MQLGTIRQKYCGFMTRVPGKRGRDSRTNARADDRRDEKCGADAAPAQILAADTLIA